MWSERYTGSCQPSLANLKFCLVNGVVHLESLMPPQTNETDRRQLTDEEVGQVQTVRKQFRNGKIALQPFSSSTARQSTPSTNAPTHQSTLPKTSSLLSSLLSSQQVTPVKNFHHASSPNRPPIVTPIVINSAATQQQLSSNSLQSQPPLNNSHPPPFGTPRHPSSPQDAQPLPQISFGTPRHSSSPQVAQPLPQQNEPQISVNVDAALLQQLLGNSSSTTQHPSSTPRHPSSPQQPLSQENESQVSVNVDATLVQQLPSLPHPRSQLFRRRFPSAPLQEIPPLRKSVRRTVQEAFDDRSPPEQLPAKRVKDGATDTPTATVSSDSNSTPPHDSATSLMLQQEQSQEESTPTNLDSDMAIAMELISTDFMENLLSDSTPNSSQIKKFDEETFSIGEDILSMPLDLVYNSPMEPPPNSQLISLDSTSSRLETPDIQSINQLIDQPITNSEATSSASGQSTEDHHEPLASTSNHGNPEASEPSSDQASNLSSEGPSKNRKQKEKVRKLKNNNLPSFPDLTKIANKFVQLVNFCAATPRVPESNITGYLKLLRFIEVLSRKKYKHSGFSEDLSGLNFLQEDHFFQPQLINGNTMIIIACGPGTSHVHKQIIIYQFVKDKINDEEINRRIRHSHFAHNPISYVNVFTQTHPPIVHSVVGSFVFCLYIFSLFHESKYRYVNLDMHLKKVSYQAMKEYVVNRITRLTTSKEWVKTPVYAKSTKKSKKK